MAATVSQSTQPRTDKDLVINITCAVSRDIRITVERFDGFFYDPADGTFKAFGSISNPYVTTSESPAGSGDYTTTLDVSGWTDGNYNTDVYDHTVDPDNPVQLSDDQTVYVDGGSGAPVGTEATRVDHNFGSDDNLRYVTSDGAPVSGAKVYAIEDSVYDADATTIQAVATTETDADGRWVSPLFLDPGTYVILIHKPNEWGPDTKTINVI